MIIGVCGPSGAGKSTFADILCDSHEFTKFGLSDVGKNAVAEIFGWDRLLLEGDTLDSRDFRTTPDEFWSEKFGQPFTPIDALQKFMTDACQTTFGQPIWAWVLEKKLRALVPRDNVVIPDVRFPSQVDMIRSLGGKVVMVRRAKLPDWYETALLTNSLHPDDEWMYYDKGLLMENLYPNVHKSEWAWVGTKFDYVIKNDAPIGALREMVGYMLDKVRQNETNQVHTAGSE